MADDELGHLPRDSTLAKCAADETIPDALEESQ
jgi:hypothetical protein